MLLGGKQKFTVNRGHGKSGDYCINLGVQKEIWQVLKNPFLQLGEIFAKIFDALLKNSAPLVSVELPSVTPKKELNPRN